MRKVREIAFDQICWRVYLELRPIRCSFDARLAIKLVMFDVIYCTRRHFYCNALRNYETTVAAASSAARRGTRR